MNCYSSVIYPGTTRVAYETWPLSEIPRVVPQNLWQFDTHEAFFLICIITFRIVCTRDLVLQDVCITLYWVIFVVKLFMKIWSACFTWIIRKWISSRANGSSRIFNGYWCDQMKAARKILLLSQSSSDCIPLLVALPGSNSTSNFTTDFTNDLDSKDTINSTSDLHQCIQMHQCFATLTCLVPTTHSQLFLVCAIAQVLADFTARRFIGQ